jgi:hypothetical protein
MLVARGHGYDSLTWDGYDMGNCVMVDRSMSLGTAVGMVIGRAPGSKGKPTALMLLVNARIVWVWHTSVRPVTA